MKKIVLLTYKHKKMIIPLTVLILLLAILNITYSLGKFMGMPFQFNITLNSVHTSNTGNNGISATIDHSRQRICFYKDNKLINACNSWLVSDHVYYDDCLVTDDGIYVQQYIFFDYINYYKYEEVVKYNLDGTYAGLVYRFEYDLEDNRTQRPQIKSLGYDENFLYLYNINPTTDELQIVKVPKDLESAATQKDVTVKDMPSFTVQSSPMYFSYDNKSNSYIVEDSNREVYKYFSDEKAYKKITTDRVENNTKSLEINQNGNVVQINYSGLNGLSIPYNSQLFIRIFFFWCSVLLLTTFLIALLIFCFYNLFKTKKYKQLKTFTLTISVLLIIAIIVITYTNVLIAQKMEDTGKVVQLTNQNSLNDMYDNYEGILEKYSQTGHLPLTDYQNLANYFELKSYTAAQYEFGINYSLYGVHDNQPTILAESTKSMHDILASMDKNDFSIYDNDDDYTIYQGTNTSWGNIYALFTPIHNDKGTLLGYYATNYEVLNTRLSLWQEQVKLFIFLITLAIAISFMILEIKAWTKIFIARYKLKGDKKDEAEISLSRLFIFLGTAISSVDSALVVIIVKDMLNNSEGLNTSFILSLPFVSFGAGYLVGNILYLKIKQYLNTKKTVILFIMCSALCYFLCFWAVSLHYVFAYIILLFFGTSFNLGIVIYATSAPVYEKDRSKRSYYNRSNSAGLISAYSLATLSAGYIADYIGNQYIYLVSLFIIILTLILVIVLIPKTSSCDAKVKTNKKNELRKSIKFITMPIMIISFFAVGFSIELGSAFKSFIFPLFANSQGFDKSSISTIIVFCNALVYYLSTPLNYLDKTLGPSKMLTNSLLIMGCCFLLFILNNSIYISIIVLVVSTVCVKIISPSFATFWQDYVVKIKFPRDPAFSAINILRSFCSTFVKGPITGFLISFSGIVSSCIIGVYVIISSIVMKIACKKIYKQNKK